LGAAFLTIEAAGTEPDGAFIDDFFSIPENCIFENRSRIEAFCQPSDGAAARTGSALIAKWEGFTTKPVHDVLIEGWAAGT
jgi:hypothetical protein